MVCSQECRKECSRRACRIRQARSATAAMLRRAYSGLGAPARPRALRMVALNMSGIACAYSGCRQNGHVNGQSVKLSAAGTTEARGV